MSDETVQPLVDAVKQREARLNKFKRLTVSQLEEANKALAEIAKEFEESPVVKEDIFSLSPEEPQV